VSEIKVQATLSHIKAIVGRHGMSCPSVTLTFDSLTLKLVCESHLRWGTFILNLGTLGLWVLELFTMYTMDGWTDRRMDERNAYCLFPMVGAYQ